ncbi:MAG: lipopolysaccharide biosynthesis protein [Pirellulales bacterium]
MDKPSRTMWLGIVSLTDQVIVSACTFLTMVLVSKDCSKAEVGVFALAWTVVNFLRTVQERTVAAPYLAFVYRPGYDRPSFRGSNLLHHLVLVVMTAAFLSVASVVLVFSHPDSDEAFVSAALISMVFGTLLREQVRSLCSAHLQFGRLLLVDGVSSLLQLGILSFIVYRSDLSVPAAVLWIGMANLVAPVIWLIINRRHFAFDMRISREDWLHNWRYAKWLLTARIFGIAGYLLVPWLIALILDEGEAGAFSVCTSLTGVSLMFINGLNNMFQPKTVREMQQHGVKAMNRCLLETVAIIGSAVGLSTVILGLFGGQLLSLIYGSAYADYGTTVFLLSLSTLAVSISVVMGNGLAALGNSKEYFWGEFACFVVGVGMSLVLVPIVGINGGAIALMLAGIAASIVTSTTLIRAAARYQPLPASVPAAN